MFEAYINELRTTRCSESQLEPQGFQHRETLLDSASTGWSIWVADAGGNLVAVVWPWALVRLGVIVLDPIRVQTNVLLLDGLGMPLTESARRIVFNNLIGRLDWRKYAFGLLDSSALETDGGSEQSGT